MVIQSNCNFFENVNAPTVSKVFSNAHGDTLSLQISGANGKYYIEGRNNAKGDWVPLAGINLSNFTPAKGQFTEAGIYEIGVVGIRELRARVESTAGGKVSIFGQIISTEET